jgi:hypothetical protein
MDRKRADSRPGVYQTTCARAMAGLAAGALAGGTGFGVFTAIEAFANSAPTGGQLSSGIAWLIVATLAAAAVWLYGLLVFAAGPWALLHRWGWRGWHIAIILGAVTTFAFSQGISTGGFELFASQYGSHYSESDSGGLIVSDGVYARHGWEKAAKFAALNALDGIIVALVIWRIAYRRAPILPPG